MANHDMHLSVRIAADAARYAQGLTGATTETKKFSRIAREELGRIKAGMGELRNQLAMLGVGFAAMQSIAASAKMDKGLNQIGQTAEMSREQVAQLRAELFRMAKETGQQVDDLQDGFNNAVQAGLNFNQALPVIDAVNTAMAVTGSNAKSLTSGLTVAAAAYQFDLAQPKMAVTLLDKMTVAGRLGNAELENLSDIFGRIGVNASSAGLGFDSTLAFVEGLSQIEKNPERLATLADSTLRVFTNLNYMKAASKATGVKFFNADGSRRDAIAVIQDLKKQYDKLTTDKERSLFVQKAFGKADLDTIKGMKAMFSGQLLNDVTKYTEKIKNAGGTLERDLSSAINNAADATGRLKATMTEAADGFTKPIRDTFTEITNFALDKKENGGLGLDGKDLLAGGATISGTALAGGAMWRMARGKGGGKGGALPAIMGEATSLGKNIAVGKTLQTAAGVTPVYVVNLPDSMTGGGGLPDVPGIPKGVAASKMAQWMGNLRGLWGRLPPGGKMAPGLLAIPAATMFTDEAEQQTLDRSALRREEALKTFTSKEIDSALARFSWYEPSRRNNADGDKLWKLATEERKKNSKAEVTIRIEGAQGWSVTPSQTGGDMKINLPPTGRYMPGVG